MGASAERIGQLRTGEELVRMSFDLAQPAAELAGAIAANPQASETWVHCLPGGPDIVARDGRRFRVEDLHAVARNTETPLLVDWEHRSNGEDTRAAGWIEEFRVEPASAGERAGLWGRVKWTPSGRNHVVQQDYRFLSPVVFGMRDKQRVLSIVKLGAVALTNQPALRLRGIELLKEQLSTRYGAFAPDNEGQTMEKLTKLVREACGLDESANEDALVSALTPRLTKKDDTSVREALSTMTSERNALDSKVKTLETELLSFQAESFKREVATFFADGSRAGKIQPAARDKWMSFALKSADNFTTFKDVIYPDLPVVGTPQGGKSAKPGKEKLRGKSSETGIDYDALRAIGLSDRAIRESEREVFRSRSGGGPGDEEKDDDDEDDADEGDPADDGNTTDDETAPAPQQGV